MPATIRDWRIFRAWAAFRGLPALPAEPGTVAAFLAAQAQAGIKASSIGRRLAAIRYAHKLAGFTEPPTNSELVRATLRGIRRTLGTAPDQKAPATAPVVVEMLKHVRAVIVDEIHAVADDTITDLRRTSIYMRIRAALHKALKSERVERLGKRWRVRPKTPGQQAVLAAAALTDARIRAR